MAADMENENGIKFEIRMQFALQYLPKEFLQNLVWDKFKTQSVIGNGTDSIGLLFEGSQEMKMYGDPEELRQNLSIYSNFTGQQHCFDYSIDDSYQTSTTFYRSLKNEEYISKLDIFSLLHYVVEDLDKKFSSCWRRSNLGISSVILVLKRMEGSCYDYLNFVQCSSDNLNKFVDTKLIGKKVKCKKMELLKYTFEELFTQWTSIFDFELNEEESQTVMKWLRDECGNYSIKEVERDLQELFDTASQWIRNLRTAVKTNPEWFDLSYNKVNASSPITVRLFVDNENKYVMLPELVTKMTSANMNLDSLQMPTQGLASDEMPTIDFKELSGIIGTKTMSKIRFILTPIIRAKHAAVPIPTHHGTHCILAIDAFLQLLQNLIHAKRVFQIEDENDWGRVEEFVKNVMAYFNGENVSTFFIETSIFEQIKAECDDEAMRLKLKTSATTIRDVSKGGFTSEDLRQELQYLNLTKAFPNVLDYAQMAYDHILRSKYENLLDTSDMYDGVQYCQMICIFERFPKLKQFLHSQKSCYRILNMNCPKCYESVNNNNTMFIDYYGRDVDKIERVDSTGEFDPLIIFLTGTVVYPATSFQVDLKHIQLSGEQQEKFNSFVSLEESSNNLPFVYIDRSDRRWFRDTFLPSLTEKVSFSTCIDRIMKRSGKMLYLRKLNYTATDSECNERCFLNEMVQILPFILKQQGIYTEYNRKKVEEFVKCMDPDDSTNFITLTINKLKEIFENFNIDKSKITLIPDPSVIYLHNNKSLNNYYRMVSLNSCYGQLTSVPHAVMFIFESIACEYNWSSIWHQDSKKEKCSRSLNKMILERMNRFYQILNTYVTTSYVEFEVASIKELCRQSTSISRAPYSELIKKGTYDLVSLSFLLDDNLLRNRDHKFPKNVKMKDVRNLKVENWRVQSILMLASSSKFLTCEFLGLSYMIKQCLLFKTPYGGIRTHTDLWKVLIYGDQKYIDHPNFLARRRNEIIEPTVEAVIMDIYEDVVGGSKVPLPKLTISEGESSRAEKEILAAKSMKKARKTRNKTKKNEEAVEKKTIEEKTVEKENVVEAVEGKKKPEDKERLPVPEGAKEIEWCVKCYRTNRHREKAAEKFHLERKKATELEKKLSVVEKELDEYKKAEDEIELKLVKKFEEEMLEKDRKLEEMRKMFEEYRQKTTSKIKEMKKRKEERNGEANRNLEEINRTLEEDLRQKDKIMERLKDTISKLAQQLEAKNIEFENFQDQQPSTSSSSGFHSYVTSTTSQEPCSSKKEMGSSKQKNLVDSNVILNKLKSDRITLLTEHSKTEANEKANRLLLNYSNRKTRDRINYELRKFRVDFDTFLKTVDNNISILEKNSSITTDQLASIPPLPSFSETFMEKYHEIMKKKKKKNDEQTPETKKETNVPNPGNLQPTVSETSAPINRVPPDELEAIDCQICLADMETYVGTLKCPKCRRRFHNYCITSWLNTNSVCPNCYKIMLDPEEFPFLS